MDLKHQQAKRLYTSVTRYADEAKAESLLSELPLSASPTEKKKHEWACASCEKLSGCFTADEVELIRKGCHCKPSPAAVKKLKGIWDASTGLADFIARATDKDGAFKLEQDGDALIMIYPTCYCSFIKHGTEQVPREWCLCTVGYSEEMFEGICGHPVRGELLESVMTGGSCCRIKISF